MSTTFKVISRTHTYVTDCIIQSALSLSLRFNGYFPGEPGLAGFIEAKDDEGGGDNWS